jgi:hypothetical protein
MTDRHGQTLKVHISDTKQIDIHIQEPKNSISENLSLSTWGASFILANQLYKIDVSEACLYQKLWKLVEKMTK